MAEMLPYRSLHHDGCWPLHGQKSCYKKCDQTELGARTPRLIPTNAVAERNGLIARECPHQTSDIDDDMMDSILNNQQKSVHPWNVRVRLVSEVVGLNGME